MNIGRSQRGVLNGLVTHRLWYPGCGWVWSGLYRTEQILDSLVKKGLATKEILATRPNHTAMVWRITEAGLAELAHKAPEKAPETKTLVIDLKTDR